VDLDAKRLEPWFQLSKPEGAVAEDSLLLHYPFEFLAFVPISALRKRCAYSELVEYDYQTFSDMPLDIGPFFIPVSLR
jgi:hypothetical protein